MFFKSQEFPLYFHVDNTSCPHQNRLGEESGSVNKHFQTQMSRFFYSDPTRKLKKEVEENVEMTLNVKNVTYFMYAIEVQAKILEQNKQTDSFHSSTNIGLYFCAIFFLISVLVFLFSCCPFPLPQNTNIPRPYCFQR